MSRESDDTLSENGRTKLAVAAVDTAVFNNKIQIDSLLHGLDNITTRLPTIEFGVNLTDDERKQLLATLVHNKANIESLLNKFVEFRDVWSETRLPFSTGVLFISLVAVLLFGARLVVRTFLTFIQSRSFIYFTILLSWYSIYKY